MLTQQWLEKLGCSDEHRKKNQPKGDKDRKKSLPAIFVVMRVVTGGPKPLLVEAFRVKK